MIKTICIGKKKTIIVGEAFRPLLGKWQMGINTTLGKEYQDGFKTIDVQVGSVDITVSLANFEGDNKDISGEQISLNIINQILYSKNKKDISESRFKRIEHLSINDKILWPSIQSC